jgi:hypothetical protein
MGDNVLEDPELEIVRLRALLRDAEERFEDFSASAANRFWEMDEEFRFIQASGGSAIRDSRPWKDRQAALGSAG